MSQVPLEQAIQIAMEHHRAGRLMEAEAIYRKVVAANPNHHDALQLLGHIAILTKHYQPAADLISRAIAIAPNVWHYHSNLATALHALGRNHEAIAAYRRAVALNPDDAETQRSLADLLGETGQFKESIEYYRCALRLDPGRPEVMCNLGLALYSDGQIEQAIRWLREAIRLDPALAHAHCNLANCLLQSGQIVDAIAEYRRAIDLNVPLSSAIHSNLLYAMHLDSSFDPPAIFQEHLLWAERHATPLVHRIQPHGNDRDPSRRLRIGYVSPDFRDHPVGRFILPIVSAHDRAAFEVHGFSDVLVEDGITQRTRSRCDGWHVIRGLSANAVADLVRSLRIDILIDLSGHAGVSRALVFAQKPAPVQLTYLGYPDTTGLRTIDYRFTDELADPPGPADSLHVEALVRLKTGFLCYETGDLPDVVVPPAMRNGFVTFGSFNSFAKVSPDVMRLWSRILEAVAGSRLLIKSHLMADADTQASSRRRMADYGLPGDRIDVIPRTATHREHLAAYGQVDIALDTFPYNGTTTTLDALAMGVPVVSLAGRNHAGRMGLSLLTRAGFRQWAATSQEQYVKIATELASDIEMLCALRSSLRQGLLKSPLCDRLGLTREIETAYHRIWRTWCAS